MPDLGRDHVPYEQVENTQYNSDPPTSGPHVVTWVKPGVYDKPAHKGELIHSLEHGYIVINYNCNVQSTSSLIKKVQAQETTIEDPTLTSDITTEASGSAANNTEACNNLISQLTELANRKKLFKLVVVPYPNLDTAIALTAWNYVDKLNEFDAARIEKFIDYHRNHGPEQTME